MSAEEAKEQQQPEEAMEASESAPAGKEPRPDPRVLTGMKGEVSKCRRFGVCVTFQFEGKAQVAALIPGRGYVNGTKNLLDECRSDLELGLVFPKGLEVNFDCVECEKPFNRHYPNKHFQNKGKKPQQPQKEKEKDEAEGANDGEGEGEGKFVSFGWRITLLWLAEQPKPEQAKPAGKKAALTAAQNKAEASWKKRREWAAGHLLADKPPTAPAEDAAKDTWFVRCVGLYPLPHPDAAEVQGAAGVVTQLLRPAGGLLKVDGGKEVYFHRARVYLDTEHLSAAGDLADELPVGTQVVVDYSTMDSLKSSTRHLQRQCPEGTQFVALLVYTETRPTLSELMFKQRELNFKESTDGKGTPREPYYMARMVSFDAASDSGVESGVAELIPVPSHAQLRPPLKRLLRSPEANQARKVRFHRRALFHLGACLENADLQYFFTPGLYGMDLFYCYLKECDASSKADGITHEVALGWKSTVSYQHSTGVGAHASTASNADATLLFSGAHSFNAVKLMAREGLDVATYEKILEGAVPPRKDYLGGLEGVKDKEEVALARVEDLFPPYANYSQVHSGLLRVESGEHTGLSAFFYRKEWTIFGFSLENADMQLFLAQNDPVFVRLEPAEKGTKVKAKECWVGWPRPAEGKQTLEAMTPEQLSQFLLWLEHHNMTVEGFKSALAGTGPERQFIPFRKEENKGTVVSLKRVEVKHKVLGKRGAVGGIIKVESGPFAGKLVQFVRKITWVLGYNMKEADLTHIFIEGQKVSLEAVPIAEDRKASTPDYNGMPVEYSATMVWTSKFIPRNDVHKTVAESPHVNGWLKKRGLTFETFKKLVKGELPPVEKALATQNKSNMLKGKDEAAAAAAEAAKAAKEEKAKKEAEAEKDTSKLPVFKHGPEAVRLCDIALSVKGPNDPKIDKLIRRDDQAQMAFHMHKALGLALERYRGKCGQGGQQQQQQQQQPVWQTNVWGQQQQQQPMQQQPMQQQQQPMQQQQQQRQSMWQPQQQQQQPSMQMQPQQGNGLLMTPSMGQQQPMMAGNGMQQQQQPMMNNGSGFFNNGQQQNQQQGGGMMQQRGNFNNQSGGYQQQQQHALKRGAPGKARPYPQANKRPRFSKY